MGLVIGSGGDYPPVFCFASSTRARVLLPLSIPSEGSMSLPGSDRPAPSPRRAADGAPAVGSRRRESAQRCAMRLGAVLLHEDSQRPALSRPGSASCTIIGRRVTSGGWSTTWGSSASTRYAILSMVATGWSSPSVARMLPTTFPCAC